MTLPPSRGTTHGQLMQMHSEAEDQVNHPKHYTQGAIECIDAIEAALGPEGFKAYCRGNAIKYLWRAQHKGNERQDLAKARWYLARIES